MTTSGAARPPGASRDRAVRTAEDQNPAEHRQGRQRPTVVAEQRLVLPAVAGRRIGRVPARPGHRRPRRLPEEDTQRAGHPGDHGEDVAQRVRLAARRRRIAAGLRLCRGEDVRLVVVLGGGEAVRRLGRHHRLAVAGRQIHEIRLQRAQRAVPVDVVRHRDHVERHVARRRLVEPSAVPRLVAAIGEVQHHFGARRRRRDRGAARGEQRREAVPSQRPSGHSMPPLISLPFVMLSDDDKFPVTVGLFTLLNQGQTVPALYSVVIIGVLMSIVPLIALFLTLQRYWRLDLMSGSVKG
jgi:hypothetical protein